MKKIGLILISTNKYKIFVKPLIESARNFLLKNNKVTYYTGFGWKKQGTFTTKEAWENYLGQFAQKINNPITVKIK